MRNDGTLWAWGGNDSGQLGLGSKDTTSHPSPTQVGSDDHWTAAFCWQNSSYALTDTGELYAWGSNDYGRLGIGSSVTERLTPKALVGASWADVAPGSLHCMALKTDGTLWGCGYNYDGELGLAPSDPVNTMTQVGSGATWSDVAAGTYHTVAVTTSDQFAACGGNAYGQLGLGYSALPPQPRAGRHGGRLDAGRRQPDARRRHQRRRLVVDVGLRHQWRPRRQRGTQRARPGRL